MAAISMKLKALKDAPPWEWPEDAGKEIIPLLRRLGRTPFFTRDLRFYEAKNRSAKYCIVCLAVGQQEAAVFVPKILRHPALNTHTKRMGKIIRVTHTGIRLGNHARHDEIELECH